MVWDDGVKLIVGLGNPGIEYQFSPHNIGFLAVDRIAGNLGVEVRSRQCRALTARTVIGGETVLLAKPETFMNLSGLSVRELVAEYEAKPESDFLRIRIGVAPDHKFEDGQRYLLAPMRKADLAVMDSVLDLAQEAVKCILQEGAAAAMNRFNRKEQE